MSRLIWCNPCGENVDSGNYNRHLKTKKHSDAKDRYIARRDGRKRTKKTVKAKRVVMPLGLFNINRVLWQNYAKAYPKNRLIIMDEGFVLDETGGLLARFASKGDASEALGAAGYVCDAEGRVFKLRTRVVLKESDEGDEIERITERFCIVAFERGFFVRVHYADDRTFSTVYFHRTNELEARSKTLQAGRATFIWNRTEQETSMTVPGEKAARARWNYGEDVSAASVNTVLPQ